MFQNALEDFQHTVAEMEQAATELKQSKDMRSQEQILTELKARRIQAFEILQVMKPQLDAVNRPLAHANSIFAYVDAIKDDCVDAIVHRTVPRPEIQPAPAGARIFGFAVWKFEGVMMDALLLLIDLPKDRGLVVDHSLTPN
jgi:hypothetical protein